MKKIFFIYLLCIVSVDIAIISAFYFMELIDKTEQNSQFLIILIYILCFISIIFLDYRLLLMYKSSAILLLSKSNNEIEGEIVEKKLVVNFFNKNNLYKIKIKFINPNGVTKIKYALNHLNNNQLNNLNDNFVRIKNIGNSIIVLC